MKSDIRTFSQVVGILLLTLAISMLIPLTTSLITNSGEEALFFFTTLFTAMIGGLLVIVGSLSGRNISIKQSFLLLAIAWPIMSFFAALPFVYGEARLSWYDAIFESMSGLTGTGATVLTNIDFLPEGILIWRSTTQWYLGLGIILIAILLLPLLKIGGQQLLQIELGDKLEKSMPRAIKIGYWVFSIYLVLTLACYLAYVFAGMSQFDAINHAFTTVATGGFSTHNSSFQYFSDLPAVKFVAIFFMIVSSLPFLVLVGIVKGKIWLLKNDNQIVVFFVILLALFFLLFYLTNAQEIFTPNEAFINSLFNITSILTTTGYASADYSSWGYFVIPIFTIAMIIGGCAGSTSGGMKIFRILILYKSLLVYLKKLYYPQGIFATFYNKKRISDSSSTDIAFYFAIYFFTLGLVTLILPMYNLDPVTSFSASLATLSNIGPGLGEIIGPVGSYQSLPDGAKLLLILNMLVGRLEIYPFFMLFTKYYWFD